jgi:hypothetical protein
VEVVYPLIVIEVEVVIKETYTVPVVKLLSVNPLTLSYLLKGAITVAVVMNPVFL